MNNGRAARNMIRMQHHILILFLLFTVAALTAQSKQKIDIQSGYLEIRPEFPDAAIYTKDASGQVYIVHDGIEMWCDQAFVYLKNNFVKAYGQVKITQGDTISLNSNYAEYNGDTQFAFASGKVVLTEPKTRLETDTLFFNRVKQQAYYRSGGTVRDSSSVLTSKYGSYFTENKKYQFQKEVKIVNPKYVLNSQRLDFYSDTGGAFLYGPSTIEGENSTVYCERGYYDTRKDVGYFVQNSRIDYENRVLYGDSLYFDRSRNFASATNNIEVIDTLNKSIVRGHYAEVFRDKDSVFITKRALAMSVRDKDTLYVHADTLRITGKPENRIIKGFYKARIFRPGRDGEDAMSGKCDSIYTNEKTGITKMLRKPVLWNGENQITGDTIHLISNTITEQLDTLKVFNNAFIIQKDSLGFNQVKGESLIGLFTNNELDTININRNTQVIYFSRNDDKELVGINHTLASSIQIYLENKEIVGIRFLKKVPGKLYPESKFPENARILPGFEWRGEERLYEVEDLFKGKPDPELPIIKGIPLPEKTKPFFDGQKNSQKLPSESKLNPEVLQHRPDEPDSQNSENP